MKTKIFYSMSAILVLLIILSSGAKAQQTQVTISEIKSDKGKVILNIFRDAGSYDGQKPFKTLSFDKTTLRNGTMVRDIALEPGIYAITSIDDENSNGKIDKSMIGMPKEGFGFSNFFMEKMKKPTFDEIKADLRKPGAKVAIRTKYM